MKHPTFINHLAGRLLAVAAALALTGAVQAQNSKALTIDLTEVRKGIKELQKNVTETTAALDAVKQAGKAGSDLKGAYGTFDKQHKQLQTQLEKVRLQGTTIRARAAEHYKAWQVELTKMGNPKLREKAQNRFEDAKEEFDEIIVIAEEAKREMGPFMADLQDVASYLSVDLSADAVKSLNQPIWKLGIKSRSVAASLDHIINQINKALDAQPQG